MKVEKRAEIATVRFFPTDFWCKESGKSTLSNN